MHNPTTTTMPTDGEITHRTLRMMLCLPEDTSDDQTMRAAALRIVAMSDALAHTAQVLAPLAPDAADAVDLADLAGTWATFIDAVHARAK
jgi:hypothetical protein